MDIKVFGTGNAFKDFLSILKPSINIKCLYSNGTAIDKSIQIPVIKDIKAFVKVKADLVVLTLRDVQSARNQLKEAGETTEILSFYLNGDKELQELIEYQTSRLNQILNLDVRHPAICGMWLHKSSGLEYDSFDWVRNTMFELVASQIKQAKMPGSVAELGVYRGDQAKLISKLFPDKVLYLFDTFEGFSKTDLLVDHGRFSNSSAHDFSNVDLKEVLQKIDDQSRLIICKGYFPETTVGIDDTFCFVSLDVDLYLPTKSGLEFFYPRMENGGVIFVHDYNNERFKGVRQAVDEFKEKSYCRILPIPDTHGSVIIIK